MTSDPGREGPDDGKAFAEPEGVPKVVEEIVEEFVEAPLAPAHDDPSRRDMDEAGGFRGRLTRHERDVLHDLLRLHRSLRGPQALLETAGNFTRPFPPRPTFISRG
jgi:hypothetical protein